MGELLYTIDSIKTFKKDLRRHAGMTGIWFVMYFIIMTVGAVLFFYIEQCYNQKARSNIDLTEQLRGDMCRIASSMRLFNGSYNQNSLSDNVSLLLNASLRFCEQPSNKKTILRCEWTAGMFSKWLFYCSSVGFTIGFGTVVPKTILGKMVTIIYAFPAIGITMTLNVYMGKFFVDCTSILVILFYTKVLKRTNISKLSLKVFCTQVILAAVLCILYGLSCQWQFPEKFQNFETSLYFAFTTFSTIGFGDYSLDYEVLFTENFAPYGLTIGSLIFYIGLGVMASVLASLGDLIVYKSSKNMKEKKKNDENKSEGTI